MYTQEELLTRFYDTFASIASKKKNSLVMPQIDRKNRKTMIVNFPAICASFGRSAEQIRMFIEKELKPEMSILGESDTTIGVSISGDGTLIIAGTYPPPIIITICQNFAKKFVVCASCKSTDTTIIKESKITYMSCNFCRAKKPI
jgi:translation initiation factor 2 beta subunit (eIF-2beta)/eIF-5